MKCLILAAVTVLSVASSAFSQTAPIYENFGDVEDAGQIDALAFANYGSFSATSDLPYDFQSTRYFTNRGTMAAFPGFRFATASSGQPPFSPAVHFLNDVSGTIIAEDQAGLPADLTGAAQPSVGSFAGQIITPSYILVSADTIVNKGLLISGSGGLVQLIGKDIDLSRSGVGVARLETTSTHRETSTNFYPDPGIYDVYWGLADQPMGVAGLVTGVTNNSAKAATPAYQATNGPLAFFPEVFGPLVLSITNTNSTFSVYTNVGGLDPDTGKPTNISRQAVFVQVSSTNFAASVKWAPPPSPATLQATPVIQLLMADTNVLTGDPEPATLYIQDFHASDTNTYIVGNTAAFPTTYRPAPIIFSRQPPRTWLAGGGAKGTLTNTFFYDAKDTNFSSVVTNTYLSYSAFVDSLASQIPDAPGATIRQAPGRVEISAQNLNLTRSRLRGTGLISIDTQNLIASTNANLDGENLSYNLQVPTGTLNVKQVAKDKVVRMNGQLELWSATFTNQLGIKMTNQVPDSSGTGTTNEVTNIVVSIEYHMLVVDARNLVNTKGVVTHGFSAQAGIVVLSDPLMLVGPLAVDSPNFTLNSQVILTNPIEHFGVTNTPHLQALTITTNGSLAVPNIANMGQDIPGGYASFTNAGFVGANGILINAQTFVDSGTLTSRVQGIEIQCNSAQFGKAQTMSAGDLIISGNNVTFTGSTNACGGTLFLNATGNLSDSGADAGNTFLMRRGFQVTVKPDTGDLLGTILQSVGPRFASVDHVWPGADRGADSSGFQNNLALGRLVLGGDRETQLSFRGATGRNGLYVGFLELAGSIKTAFSANDLASALAIDPSLTIYFVNANVSAAQLEAQSNGRLVQVQGITLQGPGASDSSGAGSQVVDNGSSSTPPTDSGVSLPPPTTAPSPLILSGSRANDRTTIALSWSAEPNARYQIEYSTSLQNPDWTVLSTYDNPGTTPRTATVQDELVGEHPNRYYRLRTRQ